MKRPKNFELSSFSELDELVTRVFCDTAPKTPADVAYLFGETADNESSVLVAASLMWKLGRTKLIALCGHSGGRGYPGFDNWKEKLVGLGVPAKKIIGVSLSRDFPPSTHAESFGLVRYAKDNDWKIIYVVAPPIHQLRAFVTVVTAVLRERSPLLIYNFVGIPQRWEEHIIHSQGVQEGTRSELLVGEMKKIEKYYKKGDLVSGEEALKYLDKRDK